jgi:hypothetical protein
MACAGPPASETPPAVESPPARDSTRVPQRTAHDWLIVPGERVGPISATTSEAELLSRLGAGAVVRREVYLAEGFCTAGNVLYPDSPDAVEIGWADSLRSRPAFLTIRGRGSRWATPAGVRIGATLKDLEALRGEPLTFAGFGWDYGGGASWQEPDAAHAVGIRLSPDSVSWETARADSQWTEILGDRPVRSDHPLVRRLNIVVEALYVGFGATWDEHLCPGTR